MAIKQQQRQQELEEERQMEEYARAIAEYQESVEAEEARVRQEYLHQTREENRRLAEERRMREQRAQVEEKQREREESEFLTTKSFLLERPDEAIDPNAGRIVRRDHFKGYTPEQRQRILRENERLMKIHQQQKDEERQRDLYWHKHQEQMRLVMEQAEYEERHLKQQMLEEQRQTLQQQMELHEQKCVMVQLKMKHLRTLANCCWSRAGNDKSATAGLVGSRAAISQDLDVLSANQPAVLATPQKMQCTVFLQHVPQCRNSNHFSIECAIFHFLQTSGGTYGQHTG